MGDEGIGQTSQSSGDDLGCASSAGDRFPRKPGLVNSRIQHFEGRIQEVVGRSSLPIGMKQIVSLDAHVPPLGHFHPLHQAAPSPCGETQTTTVTSASHVASVSLPLSSQEETTDQSSSSHSRRAAESCHGSTCVNMHIPGDSAEISAFMLASLDPGSLDVKLDVSSKTQSREEPQLCLT